MPNGKLAEIPDSVQVDITLETKMGKLVVPQQDCLIWDDMNEDILLGNQMLVCLGIDPKNALDSLLAMNTINDKQNINTNDNQIPANLPDIGENADDEIVEALKAKFQEALNNWMSQSFGHKLMQLLLARRMFFVRNWALVLQLLFLLLKLI